MICPYCRQETTDFKPSAYAAKISGGLFYVEVSTDCGFKRSKFFRNKNDVYAYAQEWGVIKKHFGWKDRRMSVSAWKGVQ